MKKKILVVITSNLYVRNYVDSGALNQLAEAYDVHLAFRQDVLWDRIDKTRFASCSSFASSKSRQRRGQLIFDVMMLRFAALSQSFGFRAKRLFPTIIEGLRMRQRPLKIMRARSYRMWIGLLSQGPIFEVFKRTVIDTTEVHEPLARAIDALSPDLVALPTSAYALEAIDIAKHCSVRNIGSLLLVDNWDNLSSKSILWERPKHIAVWGEQSREHAIDIQGFAPNQVSLIGTPRFDSYFELRDRELPSHFDFPYVLFVGTALPFNEARALQALEAELKSNPGLYGDLKIVYRPHPWRQGKDSIDGLGLERVVVDPQVAEHYSKKVLSTAFQPRLDYYPALLRNAAFVMGGVSSMLIESMIFAKRYLAIAYDEQGNLTSPKHVYANYVHFRGIERLPGLSVCKHFDALADQFREQARAEQTPTFEQVDPIRKYFLYSDDRSYASRLRELVDGLVRVSRSDETTVVTGSRTPVEQS